MKNLTLWICLTAAVMCSCKSTPENYKIDRENETKTVESAIHKSIGWAQTKDTNLLYSIIANDSNYLEVDPENRIVRGISDFKKSEKIWLDPRFKAVNYEIWDLKINISQDGTVAWYYCVLNDMNEWDGKPACWMNTRWTGVLEKREGKWVIVQMHFSFAEM